MTPLSLIALASAGDALVRVEVPNHPDALISSHLGSLLAAPPTDGTPSRPAPVAETDVGPIGGYSAWEAMDAMSVGAWHEAGYGGAGVRIAVFDLEWYGAELDAAELGDFTTHDCYVQRSCEHPIDTLRPTFSFETGSHGVACAEVIRDIAPEAALYLVRVSTLTTLENAVQWAIREDIDLISMSLSFFNESFYDGTGAINEQMDLLAEAGILMVTSAGNYADQHYQDAFTDRDSDGFHDFPFGDGLPIYLSRGSRRIYLSWDEYRSCGRTDLDAYVYSEDGLLVGRSTNRQDFEQETCSPIERVSAWAEESGWYTLKVHHAGGMNTVRFDIMARNGEVYEPVVAGSITDPGTHPSVMTVGAIRGLNYLEADVEAFSSQGPTAANLPKPDIAGPNGLSSTVYGPTGFYGTSASTPAVTGALALVMSQDPTLTPAEAGEQLTRWALPPPGGETWSKPDPGMGAGRARLPDPSILSSGCRSSTALLFLPLVLTTGLRRRRRPDAVGSR
ncbi:MAG: S8 family serine peptidase [Myxococcota bacterium]|nr:S8 family serine peptidase [Myxococcota bacterium]